ncbi:DUF6491 family protein [Altericroceibacterium endophyticum]|uniref:Lipoprotein n=1 Tax=Altericroceibacterium endophyticum TaxID=1808508 RepID=A0A6I4T4M9_9SPHN|nr:hypothetical protein [Altericroceibacterium endophyticum]MXO65101.1 hypothetical protein [Altericroceibacterium endophyticum]
MKIVLPLLALTAALSLGACNKRVEQYPVIKAPPATVTGEAVNCISTSSIQNTDVYDDYTIDFRMRDGTRYRNTLSNRCPSLGMERAFSYKSTLDRLCDTDSIQVIGGMGGTTCGLDTFVPVKLDR